MTIELKIPDVGESIQEVQVGQWLKQEGDHVDEEETVVELETDKASMDLPAPATGTIVKILKHDGDTVAVGEVIARIEQDGQAQTTRPEQAAAQTSTAAESSTAAAPPAETVPPASPSVRRMLREHHLAPQDVAATGEGGRLLREDVLRHLREQERQPKSGTALPAESQAPEVDARASAGAALSPPAGAGTPIPGVGDEELERIVPMSLIRRRIAERLVEARKNAALLTTFNEADMSSVIALRAAHRDQFREKYGVKLGFMSFFVKAAVEALGEFPAVNAEVRGTNIVYRSSCHIGVAIGGGKGLVVPVIRHAERLSFADIEQAIDDFAARAESNKLAPDELAGGTFTISNGGIYGSLLSTPIVNPPQSGVLGMHAIQDRPVAWQGQVVIRPMMYVALTYDHRIVDGREAVGFLKRIKETIEEPSRLLIGV